MSPTKSKSTLIAAGTSIAAGATQTSAWIDCRSFFEMLASLNISIPAGAPSAGPTITYQASPDAGTTVYPLQQSTGQTVAQGYVFGVDDPVMYIQLTIKNNDGTSNAIVAGADLMHIDTVA